MPAPTTVAGPLRVLSHSTYIPAVMVIVRGVNATSPMDTATVSVAAGVAVGVAVGVSVAVAVGVGVALAASGVGVSVLIGLPKTVTEPVGLATASTW